MDTPVVARYVSILKNPKKSLFQSPVDTGKENDLPGFSTPLVHASMSSRVNTQKRNRKLSWSPVKRTPVRSPPKKKSREGAWTDDQVRSLIEFVALHKDLQTSDSEWPSMRSDHVYWIKAAEYVQMIDGSTRSPTSCRSRIVNKLRSTYSTISEAEDAYSCDYEDIRELNGDSGFLEPDQNTSISPAIDVIEKVLLKSLKRLDVEQSTKLVEQFFKQNSEINKKIFAKLINTRGHLIGHIR
ncbi:uncharacterized protein LOC110456905 [Mizuhopecten yessoensis]|uniref:uncharacterized protein LOC110456905 n=1 Tax=Mizuhopecten yessoensis TaxID=6573 RepID=UPI000B45D19A|nr:uncharacterized protein LOC110456905 [Mizuhopecten yessoensis]